MGFYIPNAPDASVIDQSEPDSVDFIALGDRATGVVSGCAVTAQGTPDQTVVVASGEVCINGTYYSVSANPSLSVGTGSSAGPRFDLVVVNSSGALAVRTGTASANPVFPSLSAGDVILAAVYRTSGTSGTVGSSQIIDKRVTTPSNVARTGAGTPGNSLGSVGDLYVNTTTTTMTGQSQLWVKTGASTWENVAEHYNYGIRQQAGSTDTLTTTDVNNVVEYSGACNIRITTSSNSGFPTGSIITLVKTSGLSSNVVVDSGGSYVTVNSSLGLKLRDQWSTASLLKRSDGTWLLFGDLTTA
jgi:hypothetical protein